jgi:hypothetical protein
MLTANDNLVGLVLIAVVLLAYGVRIAARDRPDRKRWSDLSTLVIACVLIGMVALYTSFWIIPDPEAASN